MNRDLMRRHIENGLSMEPLFNMTKQIMVVDDQVRTLELIGEIIGQAGFNVLMAEGAYEALKLLKWSTPDLLILDVEMPGMDGIELCEQIRSRPETARTPVILLSAWGDSKSVKKALDTGADDFTSKPILSNDLLTRVRNLLGENGEFPLEEHVQ
jgi:DNA-binding response OmpR family regulator